MRTLLLLAIAATGFNGRLAAQTIDVRAGAVATASLAPGEKITVPVIVDIANAGALNIATLKASFSWNAAKLTLDSLRRAPGVSWSLVRNTTDAASGVASFSATSAVPLAATTTLANLFFTAAGGGGTRVVPSITSATSVVAENIVSSLRLSSTDVCVAQIIKWGDANNDGAVNIIDAQQIARFSIALSVADAGAVGQRGDVNADGSVDIIDAQQISRFSIGLTAVPRINVELLFDPTPTSISIVPAAPSAIVVGGSAQLAATPWTGAFDVSGCSAVTWQTSNASVASVNNSGFVIGHTAGSATLTATSVDNPSLHSSTTITVGGEVVAAVPDTSGLRAVASQHGVRIGTAVAAALNYSGAAFNTFQSIFTREFNVVTPENAMKHALIHPARDTYSFLAADLTVNFALANGQAVRGHTLVWGQQNASWLINGNWTPSELRTLLEEHVTTVASHFRGKLMAWDVVNEPLCDTGALCGFWYANLGEDYIEYALRAARAADPDVPLFINEFDIEWAGAKVDSLYALVTRLLARGVPLDGIGFQAHFHVGIVPHEGIFAANIARFSDLGLKVQITELDVRLPLPATPQLLEQQAADYRSVVRACLGAAGCNAIIMWGFSDKESWVPNAFPGYGDALLFDINSQPKPAYTAMRAVFTGG